MWRPVTGGDGGSRELRMATQRVDSEKMWTDAAECWVRPGLGPVHGHLFQPYKSTYKITTSPFI